MLIQSAQAFLDEEGNVEYYRVQFDQSGLIETRDLLPDPQNRHYAALLVWLAEGNALTTD